MTRGVGMSEKSGDDEARVFPHRVSPATDPDMEVESGCGDKRNGMGDKRRRLDEWRVEAVLALLIISNMHGGETVSGSKPSLDPKLVAAARREEVMYLHQHRVYDRVSISECRRVSGKAPLKTGWVDVDKSTHGEGVRIRSRWVAKEYNTGAMPDLYAGTAPLSGVKLVLSEAASCVGAGSACVGIVDVSRAFFYAAASRVVFVTLPAEDYQPGDERMCGRLRKSLYGTRDAAAN